MDQPPQRHHDHHPLHRRNVAPPAAADDSSSEDISVGQQQQHRHRRIILESSDEEEGNDEEGKEDDDDEGGNDDEDNDSSDESSAHVVGEVVNVNLRLRNRLRRNIDGDRPVMPPPPPPPPQQHPRQGGGGFVGAVREALSSASSAASNYIRQMSPGTMHRRRQDERRQQELQQQQQRAARRTTQSRLSSFAGFRRISTPPIVQRVIDRLTPSSRDAAAAAEPAPVVAVAAAAAEPAAAAAAEPAAVDAAAVDEPALEEEEPQEDVPEHLSDIVQSLDEWKQLLSYLNERYPGQLLVPYDFWGPLVALSGIIAQHFPSDADPRIIHERLLYLRDDGLPGQKSWRAPFDLLCRILTEVYGCTRDEAVDIVVGSIGAFNRIPFTQSSTWHSNPVTEPNWRLSCIQTDPIVKRLVEKIMAKLSHRKDIKVLVLGAGAHEVFVPGGLQSGWIPHGVINNPADVLPHGSQIGNRLFNETSRDKTLRAFNEMAAHLKGVPVIRITDPDSILPYMIGRLPSATHDTYVTSDGAVHTLDGRLIAEAGLDEDAVRGLREYVEETELSNRELGYLAIVLRTVVRDNLHDIAGRHTCTGCGHDTYAYYNMQCQRNGCNSGRFRYSHSHNHCDHYVRAYCNRGGCHAAGRFHDSHNCRATRTNARLNSLTPPPGYNHDAARRTLVVWKINAETGEMVAHALVGAPAIAEDMLDVMRPIWDHHYSNRIRHLLNWRRFTQRQDYNWMFRYGGNGKSRLPDQLASVDTLGQKLMGNPGVRGRMPPTAISAGLHGGEIRLGDFIYRALPYHEGVEENEEEESSDSDE